MISDDRQPVLYLLDLGEQWKIGRSIRFHKRFGGAYSHRGCGIEFIAYWNDEVLLRRAESAAIRHLRKRGLLGKVNEYLDPLSSNELCDLTNLVKSLPGFTSMSDEVNGMRGWYRTPDWNRCLFEMTLIGKF